MRRGAWCIARDWSGGPPGTPSGCSLYQAPRSMLIPIKGLAISSTASRTSGSCLTPMGTQETDFATSSAMNNFIEEAEIRMSEPYRSPNREFPGSVIERSGIGSAFVIHQLVLFAGVFADISIPAEIPELVA